jgi:hypothetical protein
MTHETLSRLSFQVAGERHAAVPAKNRQVFFGAIPKTVETAPKPGKGQALDSN